MNTIPGLSLVGAGRAGHDPLRGVVVPFVIDPTGQCTAHPIMPPPAAAKG